MTARATIPTLTWCAQNASDWPRWPCLPIKNSSNLEPGQWPRFAVLIDCGKDGIRFIDDVNVFDSDTIKSKLDAAPIADVTALEAAGWRVD